MTRPIYEPTPSRTDAVLGYGSDQLFRRPAPVSSIMMPRFVGQVDHNITVATAAETDIGLDAWQNDDSTIFEELFDGSGRVIALDINQRGLYSVNILWTWSTNFNAAHAVVLVDSSASAVSFGTPNYSAWNPTFDAANYTTPPVLGFVRGLPLFPEFAGGNSTPYATWHWRAIQRSGTDKTVENGFVEIIRLEDIGEFPAAS